MQLEDAASANMMGGFKFIHADTSNQTTDTSHQTTDTTYQTTLS